MVARSLGDKRSIDVNLRAFLLKISPSVQSVDFSRSLNKLYNQGINEPAFSSALDSYVYTHCYSVVSLPELIFPCILLLGPLVEGDNLIAQRNLLNSLICIGQ